MIIHDITRLIVLLGSLIINAKSLFRKADALFAGDSVKILFSVNRAFHMYRYPQWIKEQGF